MQRNHVQLIGTLVRTPELRYVGNGLPATTITVGGNKTVCDASGEIRSIAFYQNVELLGEVAERIAQCAAGTGVVVNGRFQNQRWEDDTGSKRSRTVIQGISVDLLDEAFDTERDVKDGIRMLHGSMNTAEIAGHLTKDAEFTYTTNGHALTKFTVAINEHFRDDTGEWQEKTSFVNVALWNDTAEQHQHLEKGSSVLVSGTLEVEVWAKDGQPRSNVSLNALTVRVLQALPASEGGADTSKGASTATQQGRTRGTQVASKQTAVGTARAARPPRREVRGSTTAR
jgi:single-strand DNA-binding protein